MAGTREIIVTPHCAPAYGFFNYDREYLDKQLSVLCRTVREQERLPVRIHPGMEVLYEGRREMMLHSEDYFRCAAADTCWWNSFSMRMRRIL